MKNPNKKTREWVDLKIKSRLSAFVSWTQFGTILGIIATAMVYLYTRMDYLSNRIDYLLNLIFKFHGNGI